MLDVYSLQTSLFFETPEEIFARVFRELKPRTALPELRLEFCRFANADSFIRLEPASAAAGIGPALAGPARLQGRISDLLAGAPAGGGGGLGRIFFGEKFC